MVTVNAIEYVSNGNADSLFCVLTDHLGSWEKVMDWDRNTAQQTHFDPWGNRMITMNYYET